MIQREMLAHMEWADAEVWRAVQRCEAAPGDAELRERLHHLHLVQGIFLQIWRGEEMVVRELSEFPALATLVTWARAYYRDLGPFLETLDDARLPEEVTLPWRDSLKERFGEVRPTRFGDTLMQVVLHTSHHRGQITTRLRALGGEPPLIDYIAWVWQGRPAPRWLEESAWETSPQSPRE